MTRDALTRVTELIESINKEMRELSAWNKVLKKHTVEQKKQPGQGFHEYGPAYRESHRLSRNESRVMRAIEVCRTALLGPR
jgi:hypothetical protein